MGRLRAVPLGVRPLLACLAIFGLAAFVIRFGLAVRVPSVHRPDEVFQALEPAHRLWSGWGVVSWEWRDGIRSWLFPGFLAGLMAVSGHLGLGPEGYLPFIAAVLSLLSLGVVAVGILLGWKHSGLVGAVLCGALCSFWPDLVYFAPKTLTEVQAGNLLVVAAGLASLLSARGEAARGTLRSVLCLLIGALLGLVFSLRFQLAPALPLVALWAARKDLRRGWLPLLLGGAVPLIALGVSDYLSWGSPFQSIWKNLYVNFVEKRSEVYGISPPGWYFTEMARLWGAALVPILVFFCIGARYAPLMAATAATVVLSHSAITHKEISFIYAAVPAILIVAGIGTATVVLALCRHLRQPWRKPEIAIGIAAAGLWTVLAVATGDRGLREAWYNNGAGFLKLAREARTRPDLCGLGLYGPDFPWYVSGGYAYLNRPVPIYLLDTPETLTQARDSANYLLAESRYKDSLPGYAAQTCSGGYCLLRRDHQSCGSSAPQNEINAVLKRRGA